MVGCKKFWVVLDSFGWFWVVSDGFGWFQVVCCFSSYLSHISHDVFESGDGKNSERL